MSKEAVALHVFSRENLQVIAFKNFLTQQPHDFIWKIGLGIPVNLRRRLEVQGLITAGMSAVRLLVMPGTTGKNTHFSEPGNTWPHDVHSSVAS